MFGELVLTAAKHVESLYEFGELVLAAAKCEGAYGGSESRCWMSQSVLGTCGSSETRF